MTTLRRPDLTSITLAVLFIGALIVGAFLILQPFLGAMIWATMIVVATWPMLLWLQRKLWGRRSIAVALMTIALLLVFVVPLTLAVATVATHSEEIVETVRSVATTAWPALPEQLARVPIFGPTLVGIWQQASRLGIGDAFKQLQPYVAGVSKWLVSGAGTAGNLLVQFLLTLIIAALMYAGGEGAAAAVHRFGRRLGGQRGEDAVTLAGQAIRGVALGVGVTALVQSVLAGIGLAIAGVPAAGLLTAVVFMLCIAQLGPIIILLPATIWLFYQDATGWGTFLLVWTIVVGSLDNVLRPILIKRGADLPLLLIFAGVIGGLLAFGLVGIFVGPVVLAVAYKLLSAWMNEPPAPAEH
ncbi:AI-2E family transporter YdiK [Rivibacter subsaxonicus]|uniref:Putative PurR-regulated permease PerM n=1 Tax=Rivibacter subsaxonicus TaxID=457575 RepID=A0A4Q7W185_9BURK|nr:AI-2E family transporter YdiK [Rivibacter subsaxonicus]RZU02981.1 putative PurR-regulated permease PerM [Rivibacter subsaxonicus]